MKLVELMTKPQLDAVEHFADSLWKKLGVDVKFTKHFLDRVNNTRNGKEINAAELIRLFKKEYQEHGREIKQTDDMEAVFKDLLTQINLPFVLRDQPHSKEIIAKTVMRKGNFSTTNREFAVK